MTTTVILPAGVLSLGYADGVEFVSPASPPVFLADDIDPKTGEMNTILAGIDAVDATVINVLRTMRASGAAVLDFGHRFGTVKKVDDAAAETVRGLVEEAFAFLVQRGDIRIDSVDAEEFGDLKDGVAWFMSYTNLRSNRKPEKVRILNG